LTNSAELVIFFTNFGFIFIGFIPPFLLLFVLYFYRAAKKPSKIVTALLLAIPTITGVVALTAPYHSLLVEHMEIISISPVREFRLDLGPWFWVHGAYSYLISMVLVVTIFYQHFHLPKFYRFPSTMMVTGVSITLLGNIFYLLGRLPEALDITIITASLSLVMFNFGIINNNNSKFVHFSRAQIYHYLDLFIFVLDEKQQIVDVNKPAINWFAANGIPFSALNSSKLESVIVTLLSKGGYIECGSIDDGDAVIHYTGGEFHMVFKLSLRIIVDARGETHGSIAVLTDTTQNWMLIEQMEEKAGMDCLTGLPNRHSYEGAKERLNAPEHLPLSVIVCDVNGLKQVNDTRGHEYGDEVIRVIAKVLESECPHKNFVARVGGDEFIYLLPHTSPEDTEALIKHINMVLANCNDGPVRLSVAFGAATKFTEDDNIDDILSLADSRMYENKTVQKQATLLAKIEKRRAS